MKLYTHPRSSAAFRVRIALNLKGCRYELASVSYAPESGAGGGSSPSGGDLRVRDYRAINPQGFVPALEDGGELLIQSLAIIEYLDARFPEPRLIPDAPLERARVQALAHVVASDIHPLNNLRVRRRLAAELGQDEPGVDRWCRCWIEEGFSALEAVIARTSDGRHCFGGRVTLADVVLVPQVHNARLHDVDLARYPTLARVAAHLETLEPFARAAPQRQPHYS